MVSKIEEIKDKKLPSKIEAIFPPRNIESYFCEAP